MDSQTQGSEAAAQEILEAPMKEIPRDPNKETDSDRVREGWEALPGDEVAVDYTEEQLAAAKNGDDLKDASDPIRLERTTELASMTANRYASVEIHFRFPDGRSVDFNENLDPNPDDDAVSMQDVGAAYARLAGVAQHYMYDQITTEAGISQAAADRVMARHTESHHH